MKVENKEKHRDKLKDKKEKKDKKKEKEVAAVVAAAGGFATSASNKVCRMINEQYLHMFPYFIHYKVYIIYNFYHIGWSWYST